MATDPGDAQMRKQIEGVRGAVAKPIVRRVNTAGPITFARGYNELSVDDTVRWLLQVWLSMLFLAPNDSPAKMLDTCMTYVMPALLNRP